MRRRESVAEAAAAAPAAGGGAVCKAPAQVVNLRAAAIIWVPGTDVSKRLAAAFKMSVITSCINHWLIMRLLPMKDPDRSWRSTKAQWKKDAESVGEDFSTFSMANLTAFDTLTKDGDHPSLYCLSDGERVHAACQVSRLMMSKYPTPILRARFIAVSPIYELGLADPGQYAQIMVALFSGIVWLSRDTLSAGHI